MMMRSKCNKCLPEYKHGAVIIAVAFLFLINVQVHAQDIHFSQFYATPVLINPANTGMSGEDIRIATNYRNQWGKLGVPFRTFYASIDKKLTLFNQSFGIGGVVIHDQSSSYNLAANEFLLSLSYSKFFKNHQITIGVQPGFVSKSYNFNELTFGSQFDLLNLLFNPSLPSAENSLTGNLHYFDLNVGIYWRTLYKNMMPSAGFSISHILNPVVTFSTTDIIARLPMKLTFHGQVIIPISGKFDVTPCILYTSMPGTNEFLLGGTEGYTLQNFFIPVKRIYAITLIRINPFSNIDAMILGCGFKFTKFDLGISYDINVSPLSRASYFNGAFELSLIFTGGQVRRKAYEPCFIY